MKLNGWKRIGIVASIIWAAGAYVYTFEAHDKADLWVSSELTQNCIAAHQGADPDNKCFTEGEQNYERMVPGEREEAALDALAPIPLGWGLAYLALFIFLWIKRGFVRSDAGHTSK